MKFSKILLAFVLAFFSVYVFADMMSDMNQQMQMQQQQMQMQQQQQQMQMQMQQQQQQMQMQQNSGISHGQKIELQGMPNFNRKPCVSRTINGMAQSCE